MDFWDFWDFWGFWGFWGLVWAVDPCVGRIIPSSSHREINSFIISFGTGVGVPPRLTIRATPSVLLTLRHAFCAVSNLTNMYPWNSGTRLLTNLCADLFVTFCRGRNALNACLSRFALPVCDRLVLIAPNTNLTFYYQLFAQ